MVVHSGLLAFRFTCSTLDAAELALQNVKFVNRQPGFTITAVHMVSGPGFKWAPRLRSSDEARLHCVTFHTIWSKFRLKNYTDTFYNLLSACTVLLGVKTAIKFCRLAFNIWRYQNTFLEPRNEKAPDELVSRSKAVWTDVFVCSEIWLFTKNLSESKTC